MLTKESITKLLMSNDKAIARALVVISANQTADEISTETTRHRNHQGWRPCHARMGTSMAQFYEKRGYLTEKQVAYWRKADKTGAMRIAIYWRQLAEAAELKAKPAVSTSTEPTEDVGNACEELLVLEERRDQLSYEINMSQDSDDPDIMNELADQLGRVLGRIQQLRDEIRRATH